MIGSPAEASSDLLSLAFAAFAKASAFAAFLPLAGSGAVPKTVRAALALTLTLAITARRAHDGAHSADASDWISGGIEGAAFGVAALIVAASASAAGSLIDNALALRPVGHDKLSGGDDGPFARIYSLAFASVFLASGAMTQLCAHFVSAASGAGFDLTAKGAVALARVSVGSALDLAAPAIAAQVIGTIVSAAIARAAPRINGLMLASPVTTALVLLAMLGASRPLLVGLADLARRVAGGGT